MYNISRTDVQCEWKKKKNNNATKKPAVEMFPPSKPGYTALTRRLTDEDRARLYEKLKTYGKFTGLCWIMSPEPEPVQPLHISAMEEIIFSEEFLLVQGINDQISFVMDKVKMNDLLIDAVQDLTVGQRNNPLWHLVRKGRLTASNFGCVLNAKRATPSLVKRLLGEYDISWVKAVAWGVSNESEAITSPTGLRVEETGIWLDASGVLGASLDGLIGKNHVLEVKCPFTARNLTLEEAMKNESFFLHKDENGVVSLKQDHVYWHQVQGQMCLTKRNFCYFVVWNTKESITLLIKRDTNWEQNIEILKDFYFVHIFPKIVVGEL